VRDVLALVALAAVGSTVIAATIGVLSLVVGDEVSIDDFGSVWRVWWLGDMGGDLLVAPLLMAAAAYWPFRRLPGRPIEAVVLAGAVVGLSISVFSQTTTSPTSACRGDGRADRGGAAGEPAPVAPARGPG
jgi:integral membrane sensor domain MASE1